MPRNRICKQILNRHWKPSAEHELIDERCNESEGCPKVGEIANLEIFTEPTKAKSREPAYSQALIQTKSIGIVSDPSSRECISN